jgi:hypothetical protein
MDGDVIRASIPPIEEGMSHEKVSLGVIVIRLQTIEITTWSDDSI